MDANVRKRTLAMTQFALLLALEAIVCFTPLGSIQFTPVLVATLSHIPVIMAAILLGPAAGSAMGFFFGLFSFLVWSFTPPNPLAAFVFTPLHSPGNVWSLVVCFAPRILIGLVAGYSFKLFQRTFRFFDKVHVLSYCLSGLLGSMTNTILVLGSIYIFFGPAYAAAYDVDFSLLLNILAGIVATNGLLEAAVAIVLTYGVCFPVKKILKQQ